MPRARRNARFGLPLAVILAGWGASLPAQTIKEIRGVVRDADSRPIAGASVSTSIGVAAGIAVPVCVETGEDGRFVLDLGAEMPAWAAAVFAYKPGLAPGGWRYLPPRPGQAEAPVEVVLKPAESFEGVVRDEQGRPVAGATAWATGMRGLDPHDAGGWPSEQFAPFVVGTPLEPAFRATTDAAGRFRFLAPAPAAVYLEVTAPGFGRYISGFDRPEGSPPRNADEYYLRGAPDAPAAVVLRPEARVAGRLVTRLPGVDLGGIRIRARSETNALPQTPAVMSGPDGSFAFAGLAEGELQVYPEVSADPDRAWTWVAARGVAVRPGATTGMTIELIRGVEVEGRVIVGDANFAPLDPEDPVGGVVVYVAGPAQASHSLHALPRRTTPDGTFRARLPPGPTEFSIIDPRFLDRPLKVDLPAEGGPIRLPPILLAPNVP